MRMDDRAFQRCVEAALDQVPAEFRPHLAGVTVMVISRCSSAASRQSSSSGPR